MRARSALGWVRDRGPRRAAYRFVLVTLVAAPVCISCGLGFGVDIPSADSDPNQAGTTSGLDSGDAESPGLDPGQGAMGSGGAATGGADTGSGGFSTGGSVDGGTGSSGGEGGSY